MRNGICFFLLCLIAVSGFSQLNIIPQPASVKTLAGKFSITKQTVIAAKDGEDRKIANLLNEYLQQVYGFKLDVDRQEGKNYIRLTTRKFVQAPEKDAYVLNVNANGVTVEGDTYAGTFYGMQTLIQLLPVDNFKPQNSNPKFEIPFVVVKDYPRFAYRGLHLDVSRHFFPLEFVKKYIDYLAYHKMNYFHWHLTDDQGWRIEIKKHPKLTNIGAWRNGTIVGRYPGTSNDNIRYGGLYTQDEVKEIVKYAADRYITVMPEIEMPGHASAAIAAYPWLSCFPEKETVIPTHPSEASKGMTGKKVQETWGIFEDIFCAGKDSVFTFWEEVLDEVLPLFPSKYIHVGGDEAPKNHWKKCPACQARIKAEGLKDEHELQSYFIQRMEKYLNSKGRILIGWDEILEGGLAPNAWVMSWRGEKGGIEAAKENHNVIMTPGEHVYLDHSQTKNEDSIVIGGYTPVEKIYGYEPIPKELPADKAKYVQGAQGNVWTEYMKYPSKVEYHIFPRASALSEVLWSPKEKRNWNDFEKRLMVQFKRYDLWKANYSRAYFDIKVSIMPAKNYEGLVISASSNSKDAQLGFVPSMTSSLLLPYKTPLVRTSSNPYIHFKLYKTSPTGTVNSLADFTQKFHFNKATGKKASIVAAPNSKYPGQGGAFSLVNGVYSHKGLSYPDWLGWIGDDMEVTIDLGKKTSFDSVRMHTLDQNGSWIYLPQYVEVLVSNDGKKFTSVARATEFVKDTLTMGWITVSTPKQSARYIKVIAKNYGSIPDGKPGGGNKAWLFADEIQVY